MIQSFSAAITVRSFACLAAGLFLVFQVSACSEAGADRAGTSDPGVNTLTEAEKAAGWKLIFDGETLSGWRGLNMESGVPEGHWVVDDGAIRKIGRADVPRNENGQPSRGGDILFDQPLSHFEFAFEFKVSPGANSGIKYNVDEKMTSGRGALGFEYQVLDNAGHPDGRNDPNRWTAGLYDLVPPVSDFEVRPVGEWNTGRIVFHGNRGEHWLNGKKVVDYELGTYMMDRLLSTSKWSDNWEKFGERRPQGYLVLQDHNDEVWYRNLKVRELPAP